MNDKFENFLDELEERSMRNIDGVIDGAVSKMRSQKRKNRVMTVVSLSFMFLATYTVALNTSIGVQAFVLEHDVLRVISQPLIFNDIFEEVETTHYSDDLISVDFVLNNFEGVEVSRVDIPPTKIYEGLHVIPYISGSGNNQFYFEFNTESHEVMDYPPRAIWRDSENGPVEVYTYNDAHLWRTPVLFYDNVLYVEDRFETEVGDNYFDSPRNIYAITESGQTLVYSGQSGDMMKQFFVSDGTPYLMFVAKEADTQVLKAVNLLTKTVKVINHDLQYSDVIVDIDVNGDTFLIQKLSQNDVNVCGQDASLSLVVAKTDGTTKEFNGCLSRKYSLLSDTYIFGQSIRPVDQDNAQYHVITIADESEYLGSNTSAVFNQVKDDGAMVAVMRLKAIDSSLEVELQGDLSDIYSYQEIGQEGREVLLVGDHSNIKINVREPNTRNLYQYIISSK